MNTKETIMHYSRRCKTGYFFKYSSIRSVNQTFRPGCWLIIPHSSTETQRVRRIFRRLRVNRVRNNLCRSL